MLVGNPSASPSPLSGLLAVPIAYLHALIEKTASLRKPPDTKVRLSFDALNREVEPAVGPGGVGLRIEGHFEGIIADEVY